MCVWYWGTALRTVTCIIQNRRYAGEKHDLFAPLSSSLKAEVMENVYAESMALAHPFFKMCMSEQRRIMRKVLFLVSVAVSHCAVC